MTSEDSPFKEGTKIYRIFTTLLDQKWHCGKHKLPGTQPAKAIQIKSANMDLISRTEQYFALFVMIELCIDV